jgi:hypothetical protein
MGEMIAPFAPGPVPGSTLNIVHPGANQMMRLDKLTHLDGLHIGAALIAQMLKAAYQRRPATGDR